MGNKKITDTVYFKTGVSVLIGLFIFLLPTPEALQGDPRAWRLLSIFVATIAALMLNPAPMGHICIVALTLLVVTRTFTIGAALSGFANSIIWLIACAFLISRGFVKTGLGERIAYLFMAKLGKKTLGLAYSLVFAEGVLSLAMPSNTARSGGVIFPIVKSLTDSFNSKVEDGTRRRMGSYLMFTIIQTCCIWSAMFLTGMAANALVVSFAGAQGVEITYLIWLAGGIVPGLICILIIPFFIYKVYPPEIKETPEAAEIAKKHLQEMGQLKKQEKMMLFVFALVVTLWIIGAYLQIDATTTAFIGLSVMLTANVINFEDVKKETGAWDALIWFACLLTMAAQLNALGVIGWLSEAAGGAVYGMHWIWAFTVICLFYFYSHYFFASATAHISAMYAGVLAVAIAIGTPPMLAALMLGYFSALCMGLTHYGTGPSPIYYGPGYIKLGEWWGHAFIISVVTILVFVFAGGLWWRLLGFW